MSSCIAKYKCRNTQYSIYSCTITTYTYGVGTFITRVSTGVYKATVALEQAGYWKYRWASPFPNTGAVESTFTVTPSIIP